MPKIKVCCISSIAEANLAIEAGADAIGLVSTMPSGPGVIGAELIELISKAVPPCVDVFLLTSMTTADDIADQVLSCSANVVQITCPIETEEYARLSHLLPKAIRKVQVIHVDGVGCLEYLKKYAPYVDAFILDSGKMDGQKIELGGTGRIHDWNVSTQFVEKSAIPVFLAGGLNHENVRTAINRVKPYGVDVCSGVRNSNVLIESLLTRFISNARDSK